MFVIDAFDIDIAWRQETLQLNVYRLGLDRVPGQDMVRYQHGDGIEATDHPDIHGLVVPLHWQLIDAEPVQ